MSDYLVHVGATVQCTHRDPASAQPNTSNQSVKVSGQQIVTQADIYTISQCPNPANAGGPCLTAQWTQCATRVRARRVAVVLKDSQAKCLPTNAQLTVCTTQTRVKGT